MTHYADLSPYAYCEEEIVDVPGGTISYRPRCALLNVGWLDAPHEFGSGPVPDGFADALLDIIAGSRVNTMRGFHVCTHCPLPASHRDYRMLAVEHGKRTLNLGFSEIRVPSDPGTMSAAPTLIWHYVTAHGYRPPDGFITAVRGYDPSWISGPWIPAGARHRDHRR
ncbi:hypothetical protein [Actinoplanes sp. NPDC049802]|uniref:DUF7919 family protein n=1 Tax=Actinoplanes sp. NPDC049802 TaxID=3154742 RepID=UPI0033E1BA8A